MFCALVGLMIVRTAGASLAESWPGGCPKLRYLDWWRVYVGQE